MIIAAVVIIPMIFFQLGGPELFTEGMARLTPEQSTFFSKSAILEQGAPFFVAVLAYAIGNQTIAQRLFAVREDLIKPTFITATIGYGAIVIGLGMLGFLALLAGVQPLDGDLNNLIPQMAATYLPPFVIGLLFLMVIGALSSTADSDLSALSALVMTDVYGKNIAKGKPNPTTMLWVGRVTMIVATMVGVIFASLKLDILTMLIFVGALWGTIVFPVIASLFWKRVTNKAFTSAVVVGFGMFLVTRFELLPMQGAVAVFFELCASVGGGVVIGMMAFGFFGRTAGLVFGFLAFAALAPFAVGFLRDYTVLLSSLTAYGVSTMVCVAVSLRSQNSFDFDSIGERVVAFQTKAR
jgi:Na+/proline symporter